MHTNFQSHVKGGEERIPRVGNCCQEEVSPTPLDQVSPEELTLVYNLRKMVMNNWVSSGPSLQLSVKAPAEQCKAAAVPLFLQWRRAQCDCLGSTCGCKNVTAAHSDAFLEQFVTHFLRAQHLPTRNDDAVDDFVEVRGTLCCRR